VTQPKPTAIPGAVPVRPMVERALAGTLTKVHPQLPAIRALLDERTAKGVETYGAALAAPNGRDFLRDAIEEAADLVQYLAGLRHLASLPGAVNDAAHIDRLRVLQALATVAYNEATSELRARCSEQDALPW
jgi:hypothetical protein